MSGPSYTQSYENIMGDESQALNDRSDEGYSLEDQIEDMQQDYEDVKRMPIGSAVFCPVCCKKFKKKTKGHAFCCNKGKGNCKDRYWNLTNYSRRERAKQWT